jgi:hypothetical protein
MTEGESVARPSFDPERTITAVSGMPRSGTSMLMQMLEASGLACGRDGQRVADVDNPKGYFELADVKRMHEDTSFLAELTGRAVRIVAHRRAIEAPMQVATQVLEFLGANGGGFPAEVGTSARRHVVSMRGAPRWHASSIRRCGGRVPHGRRVPRERPVGAGARNAPDPV